MKTKKLSGERLRKQLATVVRASIMRLPKNTLVRVVRESEETRGRVAFRIVLGKDGRSSIQVQSSFEQRVLCPMKPVKL